MDLSELNDCKGLKTTRKRGPAVNQGQASTAEQVPATPIREYSASEVYRSELYDEIVQRRRLAGLVNEGADDKAIAAAAEKSLVGLAFSGGGIRAAAFCLGVLQAFQAQRLMRYVDYLSTVSGGGYVGSLFSSLVNHPAGLRAWRKQLLPAKDDSNQSTDAAPVDPNYSIDSEEGGRQPSLVRRIANSGPQLRRPLWFGSAYFFGLTLTNLVALPGMVAVTILAAILFRSLDHPRAAYFIDALGFKGDFARAFFPSFVLTLLWAALMVLGSAVQSLSVCIRIGRAAFALLVASLAMAVVSLIGTGDIDVTVLTKWLGVDSSKQYMVPSASRMGAIFVLLIALIPYLKLPDLVRSGIRPRGFMDRWVFAVASTALLCGVPLVLFGYFASENISGFNPTRIAKLPNHNPDIKLDEFEFSESSTLAPIFFVNWPKFWLTVESSAKPTLPPNDSVVHGLEATRQAADKVLWAIANGIKLPTGNVRSEDKPANVRSRVVPASPPALAPAAVRLFQARFAPARVLSPAPSAEQWSRPTDLADVHRAESVSQEPDDATIIDLEQDNQADSEDYINQPVIRKWWYLTGLPWRSGNSLAEQVERDLEQRQRDESIARRLNYQFVSNLFVASALLLDLSQVLEQREGNALKAENAVRDQTIRRAIDALDRSAAAAAVRRFAGEFKFSDSLEPSPIKLNQTGECRDDEYLRRFLTWQNCKHQLLWLKDNDSAEIANNRQLLVVKLGEALRSDKAPSHQQRDFEALEAGIREFNLAVLSELLYPEALRPQSTVYSSIVLIEDQKTRWRMFSWTVGAFVVAALLINLNFTSIHNYYQSVLSKIWIVQLPGLGDRIPLAQLDNTRVGAPYHLLHGTVSLRSRAGHAASSPRSGFLFSKLFCGGIQGRYVATSEYRDLDLPTAMAISGAAITPSAVNNRLVWAIMFLCNFRTGQWLAWPGRTASGLMRALYRFALQKAGMAWHVMLNRCLSPARQSMAFVYDGGLYENLGVEPLLARRCRLIIAVDASEDGESRFEDFQSLVQRSRLRYGVTIQALEPQDRWMAPLTPKFCNFDAADNVTKKSFADRLTTHGFVFFRINYPSTPAEAGAPGQPAVSEGTLIYLRPSLAADLCPQEVLGFARNEPEFPQDSTINQFYTSLQFDAYRKLGESIGAGVASEVCERIKQAGGVLPPAAAWERTSGATKPTPAEVQKQTPPQGDRPPELQDPHLKVPTASKENIGWLIQVCSSHIDEFIRHAAEQSLLDPNNPTVLERKVSTEIARALLDRNFAEAERKRLLLLIEEHHWSRGANAIWSAVEQLLDDPTAETSLRAMSFEMVRRRKAAEWAVRRVQMLEDEGPTGWAVLHCLGLRPTAS